MCKYQKNYVAMDILTVWLNWAKGQCSENPCLFITCWSGTVLYWLLKAICQKCQHTATMRCLCWDQFIPLMVWILHIQEEIGLASSKGLKCYKTPYTHVSGRNSGNSSACNNTTLILGFEFRSFFQYFLASNIYLQFFYLVLAGNNNLTVWVPLTQSRHQDWISTTFLVYIYNLKIV